jgi:hypothetical protein
MNFDFPLWYLDFTGGGGGISIFEYVYKKLKSNGKFTNFPLFTHYF